MSWNSSKTTTGFFPFPRDSIKVRTSGMELTFNSTEASKETVGKEVIGSTEMDGLR